MTTNTQNTVNELFAEIAAFTADNTALLTTDDPRFEPLVCDLPSSFFWPVFEATRRAIRAARVACTDEAVEIERALMTLRRQYGYAPVALA